MKIISKVHSDFAPSLDLWLLRSERVEQTYRVSVAAPLHASTDGPRPGVLYALDGNSAAGTLIAATRSFASVGELPPLFVVSIGYPLDGAASSALLRTRDLTPWPMPALDDAGKSIWGEAPGVASGGADAFRAFLADELQPWVRHEYPVDPGDAAIIGSSLAGLFALSCLVARPEIFNRYNLVNPSVWFNQYKMMEVLQRATADGFAPRARVFLSAGGYETERHLRAWVEALPAAQRAAFSRFMDTIGWVEMARDVEALAESLAQIGSKQFAMETVIFPRETHESVYFPAVSRGLRMLYDTPVMQALDALG